MPTVVEDLRLGALARMSKDGDELTRVFFVTGLVPGKDTLRCWGVQDSTTSTRVPTWGDAHPTAAGANCSNLTSEPWPAGSNSQAKVTAVYTWPNTNWGGAQDTWVYRIIDSNTREIMLDDPETGAPIQVTYHATSGAGQQYFTSPCFDLYTETTDMIIEVVHSEAPGLFDKNLSFRKRLNSTPFWGRPAYTVLCSSICGETIQNGTRVNARYRFVCADSPSRFLKKALFFNDRGKTPEEVLTAANFLPDKPDKWDDDFAAGEGHGQAHNGVRVVRLYKTADLNGLNIPKPTI